MDGRTMGYFAGRFLATVVVIPLAYYLISIIFYAPNKVTKAIIQQYMTDTVMLNDNIDKEPPLSVDSLGLQLKTYTVYRNQYHSGNRNYSTYIFYSKTNHKYFNLISIVEGGGMYDGLVEYMNIITTVNKEDLSNPAYGTKANPVPVFKFVGADTSIRPNNQDYDKAYMDTVFRKNVEIYLQYIMPKKEFKTRYGK